MDTKYSQRCPRMIILKVCVRWVSLLDAELIGMRVNCATGVVGNVMR
jgi:hypothetical protein